MSFQKKALELLREKSSFGESLENHCSRLAQFTLALGIKHGVSLEEDLVRAACWLHDIGLCVEDPEESNYLKRGLKFSLPFAREWGMSDDQLRIFEDIMLYNHSVKKVPGLSPQGEMVRQAVGVEHSFGVFKHGLERHTIKQVLKQYPRLKFNSVLASFFKTSLIDDGPSHTFRAFLPKKV